MGRFVMTTVAASVLMLALAAPVWAFQCPKLVKQIEDESGQRFDDAAYDAARAAEQATALHKEGKHAEAEAKAKMALKTLGL